LREARRKAETQPADLGSIAVGAAQGGKMPSAKAKIWAKYLGKQPKKAKEIAKRRIERWLKEEIEEIG